MRKINFNLNKSNIFEFIIAFALQNPVIDLEIPDGKSFYLLKFEEFCYTHDFTAL
jgi:hypothetical protein